MRGAIDTYVRRVERLLPGHRRVRKDLLAELRDGLDDAAEAYREAGMDARGAELRAVSEAGPAQVIAAEYHEELAAAQGQRTAALLGLTLPAMVLSWTVMWRFGGDGVNVGQWPVSELVLVLSRVVDWAAYAGGAFALAGLAALLWTARSGRAGGWVVKTVAVAGGTFLLTHVVSNIVMNVLLIRGGFEWQALFLAPPSLLGMVTMTLTVLQARAIWRTLKISFSRPASTS